MVAIFYARNLRTYEGLTSELPSLSSIEFTAKDSANAKDLPFQWLPYQDRLEEPLPSPRRLAIRLKNEFETAHQTLVLDSSVIIVTDGLSFGITVEALAQLKKTPRRLGLIAFYPQSDVLTELQQAMLSENDFQKYVPRHIRFSSPHQSLERARYFKIAERSRFDFMDVCAEAAHKLSFCELILPPHGNNAKIPRSVMDFYNASKGIVLNTELQKDCTYKDQSAALRDSIYRAARKLG